MTPKGTALVIGGSEQRGDGNDPEMKVKNKDSADFEILKQLIPNAGKKGTIEIITTASDIPGDMAKMYEKAFSKLGFKDVGYMKVQTKEEAREEKYCKRVEKAHAVLFTGGDQFRLSAILGGTPINAKLKERFLHDKDFIVAGTSAGAMVLPAIMIYDGVVHEALMKPDIHLSSGLGIFDTCIIDTHFIKRGRFARLVNAVVINPELLGIGLGEDTALKITGYNAECFGSGSVIVIDGREIGQTNIADVDEETPIYVENLKVHLLTTGCRISLKERKLFDPVKKKSPAKADK